MIEKVESYCKALVQIVEPVLVQRPNEHFIRAYEGAPRNENEVAKVAQSWLTTLTDVDDNRVRLKPPKSVSNFRKWEHHYRFHYLEVLPGPHRFSVEHKWQKTFEGETRYVAGDRVTEFKKVTNVFAGGHCPKLARLRNLHRVRLLRHRRQQLPRPQPRQIHRTISKCPQPVLSPAGHPGQILLTTTTLC